LPSRGQHQRSLASTSIFQPGARLSVRSHARAHRVRAHVDRDNHVGLGGGTTSEAAGLANELHTGANKQAPTSWQFQWDINWNVLVDVDRGWCGAAFTSAHTSAASAAALAAASAAALAETAIQETALRSTQPVQRAVQDLTVGWTRGPVAWCSVAAASAMRSNPRPRSASAAAHLQIYAGRSHWMNNHSLGTILHGSGPRRPTWRLGRAT